MEGSATQFTASNLLTAFKEYIHAHKFFTRQYREKLLEKLRVKGEESTEQVSRCSPLEDREARVSELILPYCASNRNTKEIFTLMPKESLMEVGRLSVRVLSDRARQTLAGVWIKKCKHGAIVEI